MTNDQTPTNHVVTSLVQDTAEPPKKAPAKKAGSKNRRKSRELVMKAIYRGMLNETDSKAVLRDMTEDPDYAKADEAYFRHLLDAVNRNVVSLDAQLAQFIDRKVAELSPVELRFYEFLVVSSCLI